MSDPFKPVDRDTPYLLPPSLQDWLPQEHLARFVVEIVDRLDLSELERAYGGRGKTPYHPSVMVALLFYGYATGVFSSRKLEQATYDSVSFRYITADTHPDHDTIAHFRKRFLESLRGLFVQILVIAQAMGVLKIGTVSLDGTKVRANASKHKAMSWGYANRLEAQLREEVKTLLEQAARADTEASPGLDIPEELARRESRLAAIERAKTEIERRALRSATRRSRPSMKRSSSVAGTPRRRRGRKRAVASRRRRWRDHVRRTRSTSPMRSRASCRPRRALCRPTMRRPRWTSTATWLWPSTSATTPMTSRSLHRRFAVLMRGKRWLVSRRRCWPMRAISATRTSSVARPRESSRISRVVESDTISRWQSDSSLSRRVPAQPDGVPAMVHRMKTPEGRALYAKRKSTVETVFGVVKEVMGFRRFHLRGLEAVQGEWALVCMAWNLKRMHVAVA